MINLKEAFEDLHDRMQKQIAEKIWEIERVKKLKGDAFYQFAGAGIVKKKLMNQLKEELKERKENLRVLNEVIKKYANKK